MSKSSKNSSVIVPTIWKRFPHRIKGLLKRDIFYSSSPPPSLSQSYTKSKSSLIYRIFPSSKNKKYKPSKDSNFIQLKNSQWVNNHDCHVELDICNEIPLRANLMSLFNSQQQQQQQGWSNLLNTGNERFDGVSRVYIGTLGKVRLLNQYTMEQQIAIHHLLSSIQNNSFTPKKVVRSGDGPFQRDFNSLLSGRVNDAVLMNNRKSRRTRYIFMLLSTPASHVIDKIHPVTEALSKLRRPYAETIAVITSEKIPQQDNTLILKKESTPVVAYKFVPADYLLDPATLRGPAEPHQNRLGTKYNGGTNQQQQQQQKEIDLFNQQQQTDSSTIAPFMAKIQIQTN